MSQFTDSAGSKSIDQREHNIDASAKRMILRAQDVDTGAWVNIGAVDKGDGTYAISTGLSVGAATETQQIIQGEVLEEIEHAIQSIASAKGVAGDIRVTILSGTVTTVSTVTTVTTLSNQSSMGGWTASSLVPAISNTTAVLSNINNVGV